MNTLSLSIPISFFDFRSNNKQAHSGALNAGRELPGTCSKAKTLGQQVNAHVEVNFAKGPVVFSVDIMLHYAAI